jgi:hypothetical protein
LYDDVTHHYHVINSVTGALSRRLFVKVVTKVAKVVNCIVVGRRAVTVCHFHHVHTLMFESRASHVIDSLEVAHVLTDIRQIS